MLSAMASVVDEVGKPVLPYLMNQKRKYCILRGCVHNLHASDHDEGVCREAVRVESALRDSDFGLFVDEFYYFCEAMSFHVLKEEEKPTLA
mmetsp:Transcript_4912/g.21122  ORF Transcript_4912/g.21122 Transcript_4912/m.21122 type:complete len:91 (-) Transcript_4912:1050-1322(-)